MYEIFIAITLFWFVMLCLFVQPKYLRIVRYEVFDRCYVFKFMLSDGEWERVKAGFHGTRMEETSELLSVRVNYNHK